MSLDRTLSMASKLVTNPVRSIVLCEDFSKMLSEAAHSSSFGQISDLR